MLENLVKKYCETPFSPKMKFHRENGERIEKKFIFTSAKSYLDDYLTFYKTLPNLEEVVRHSCFGVFEFNYHGVTYRIRHPHQQHYKTANGEDRGIEVSKLNDMSTKLLKNVTVISQTESFDDIYEIVKKEKISGFGTLAIYDTSVRIGSYLNISPNHVYLHAGAQQGMSNLEDKALVASGASEKAKVPVAELPEALKKLHPIQIENFLCLYKSEF
ncbi:hypothetical protein QNE33_004749 [Vibrio alginolyticus]|nr:hypothetical protein [Vibrio alginolyticus]ELB2909206.1 hypothetical protein [Vibrio alginolyticus]